MGRKYLKKTYLIKDCYPIYIQYKELIKPNSEKANNLNLKCAKDFIKHLIKEDGK